MDCIVTDPETGIVSLKVVENYRSYHKLLFRNTVIKYVGIGRQLFSGYPVSHQFYQFQKPFITSYTNQSKIPVTLVTSLGQKLLGNYIITDFNRAITNSGFVYIEFTLKLQKEKQQLLK